jgi:hypothetical protein
MPVDIGANEEGRSRRLERCRTYQQALHGSEARDIEEFSGSSAAQRLI